MSESERELRLLVAERVAAVHPKDPRPLADRHAADAIAFNVLPPLQLHGAEDIGVRTQTWFDSYSGDIGYDVEQLTVHVDGAVGFCSFLYHVTGSLIDGAEVDMWVRATLGCRRIDGAWKIVHDHESVLFDPETGTALIGPEPRPPTGTDGNQEATSVLRKLAVTQNITLDGVIDMTVDWHNISGAVVAGAEKQVAALQQQAAAADAFLVGRNTFLDMRGYWPSVAGDETGNTDHLNRVAKYVVSSTLTDPEWENSTIIRGLDDVRALKAEPGDDIVVTGSIRLTHALIGAGLVDEYRLFVFPAIVGHGARLFEGSASLPRLRLQSSRSFANGVVLSVYEVER